MNHVTKLVMATAVFSLIGIASVTYAENASEKDVAAEEICPYPPQKGMEKFRIGKRIFRAGEALSEEQIEKLEAQRAEFHNATRDLHMELQSQKLALKSELAKKEPDAKKAKALQKEISALNAELEQKRIEHLLEMKKIAPYGDRMVELGENRVKPERHRSRHRFQRSNNL